MYVRVLNRQITQSFVVPGTPIPENLSKVWMYLFYGYLNKNFKKTCPYDMDICLAWTEKLGLPASKIQMPEWLPQEHHSKYFSFNVPNMCVCPCPPRREEEVPE